MQGYVLFRVRRVFGAHLEVPCLYTCANFEKKVRRLLANQKENEQINDNENSCAVLSANRVIVLHGHTSGPRVLVAWRGQLPTADVLNGCARCAGDKCDKRALSRSLIWLPAHSDWLWGSRCSGDGCNRSGSNQPISLFKIRVQKSSDLYPAPIIGSRKSHNTLSSGITLHNGWEQRYHVEWH